MSEFFNLVVLVMGISITHVVCAKSANTENPPNPGINPPVKTENSSKTGANSNAKEESPFGLLTCTLFDNHSACSTLCSMFGAIYGDPIRSGICDNQKVCQCKTPANATLEEYWNAKFNSDSLLDDIQKNTPLSKKVLKVLEIPQQNYQKTLHDLRPLLVSKQIKQLRPRDKPAQTLIIEDGIFDESDVQQYADEKLKSAGNVLPPADYEKTLINSLRSVDETKLNHILGGIRRMGNKSLNDIIDEYVEKHQIPDPKSPSNYQDSLMEILEATIVNQTIGQLSSRQNSRNEKVSSSADEKNTDNNAPWILQGFDKNQLPEVNKNEEVCWRTADYHVCLTNNASKTKLYWKNENSNALVLIEITNDGDIKQDWKFEGNRVTLNLKENTSFQQNWQFKDTAFELSKNPDGTGINRWHGPENSEALKQFETFIDSWCDNNDFFVGSESCDIYKKTTINDTSDWIIPEFDKKQVDEMKNGRKCWEKPDHNVCLTKTDNKNRVYWKNKKNDTVVDIEVFKDGNIVQEWIYQRNHVELKRSKENRYLRQIWKFAHFTLEINRSADGSSSREVRGIDDSKAVKKYQKFIDSWCENNGFFIGQENCSIYAV